MPRSIRRFSYRACLSVGSPAIARSIGVGRLATSFPAIVYDDASNAVDDYELQAGLPGECTALDTANSVTSGTKVR